MFLQDAISNVQNVKIAFILRDTECSFDKKIICIFMVSSPFSFQKSIPTPEICYFEGTRNRSQRIMHLKLYRFRYNLIVPVSLIKHLRVSLIGKYIGNEYTITNAKYAYLVYFSLISNHLN